MEKWRALAVEAALSRAHSWILFAAVLLIASSALSIQFRRLDSSRWSIQRLEEDFVAGLSNDSISGFLLELTREPHVAGTPQNFHTARFVYESFQAAGIQTHYADFEVLLSYPLQRSLSLLLPNGSTLSLGLKEEAVEGDPSTSNPDVIPTFFPYVPSGTVCGEAVYANYGRAQDFETLRQRGVDVRGAVVLARIGKIFRGDIVANAAAAGAAAALVFSDPFDYAKNGTEGFYPSSQWLPPSGVQRGSVLLTSGDILTPGWPSTPNAERVDLSETKLPKILALPISAQDALPILAALGGEVAPADWQGGLRLPEYRLGRGPAKLNFSYEGNLTVTAIRNVIGMIKGSEEPDRYLLVGNHRDAWTFGGADPSSGTACLLEIARGFGKFLKQGWQPKRTLVFCSWDAEEYGLIGSTEWVEQNLDMLTARAIAYINVDRSVGGPNFDGCGTPQLDNLLMQVTKKVKDPNSVFKSVYDSWCALNRNATPVIGRLGGSRSDFSSFLHRAGIPSYDLRYQTSFPVYHSLYDDYNWMKGFGDPLFQRHVAMSAIWGLLSIHFINDDIIPFDYSSYASVLEADVRTLKGLLPEDIDVTPLLRAISELQSAARQINAEASVLATSTSTSTQSSLKRRSLNDRLMLAERSFLDPMGLAQDPSSKHLIYGQTTSDLYGSQSFPGISLALANALAKMDKSTSSVLQHEIWKVARAITNAARVLSDNFH
ncbi:probable glutamate carboxypeptidase LAMP1 [Selaginella moellendorffii]|uniref:probable glutamate carboxypeptidase LAMP1 n=1 Tax=Selaginella moellendorffii TaxID=88036 RepID=UPI000D1CBAB3|nr:probable glutamate carboxypeptidase LAMP1 [Selaginella moellendorffii]|eukprot:XP_024528345.1 probable glutamate carboxypeptidase LAMP1 [Selaginella moellendorffii]